MHANRDGGRKRLHYPVARNTRVNSTPHRIGRLAMNEYLIIYERAEDGSWGAWVPDIDGVVAAGDTRDEVEALMREALPAHIKAMRENGETVPGPQNLAGYIAA